MEDNKIAVDLVKSIITKSREKKISWQVNSNSTGFFGFLEKYSLEIKIPNEADSLRAIMPYSMLLKSEDLIYKPREDEFILYIKDLNNGKTIIEIAASLFTSHEIAIIGESYDPISKLAEIASRQVKHRKLNEANKALDEINKL